MLKRHLRLQRTVEEYGRNIKQLAGRAQSLLAAGHPEGCVCSRGTWQVAGTGPGAMLAKLAPDWPHSILCLGLV